MTNRQIVFTDTIASGASTAGGVDLGINSWNRVYAQIGSMSTSAALTVWNKVTASASYYQVFHPVVNSTSVQCYAYTIASSVGTNGGVVELPPYLNYIQLRASGVVSGGVAINIVCEQ